MSALAAKTLLVHVHNRKRIQFNLSGIYPMLPLGIAMLGAQLEQAGYHSDLLDLSLLENSQLEVGVLVARKGYDLVGLSATVFSLPETIALVNEIKNRSPETFVAVGGPATAFSPQTLFHYMPRADAFVFGEGESAIVKIRRFLDSANGDMEIPGVAHKVNGEIFNPALSAPMNMDDLPLPARHLLPHQYKMHPPFNQYPPITLIESARGCPYQCAFCSLPRQYRFRSVEHVLREVHHVIETEGVQEIHFVDPTFTADRERTEKLCIALAPLGLKLTCKTRLDLVNPALLKLMKEAGFYMISYGVETFEDRGMQYLNKHVNANSVSLRLNQTKQAGIDILAYMLLGNPGEDFSTVRRSVSQLLNVGVDFALFSDLYPDPGTPITDDAIEKGFLTKQEMEEFYFRHKPLVGNKNLCGHEKKKVKRWVLFAFIGFYFSPRTLWRILSKATNYRQFFRMAKAGFNLLADMVFPERTV